jgi:hypothetical protein
MSKNGTLDLTPEVMAQRVLTEVDFIAMKHYGYDIKKLEERYEECPDHIIAKALLISEEDVVEETKKVILKLRNLMGIVV